LCSVCAPFIINAPLNYWKRAGSCHAECSVRKSPATILVNPVYQALIRRRSANDGQLWPERRDDPKGGPTGDTMAESGYPQHSPSYAETRVDN